MLKEKRTGKRLGALFGKGQYEVQFDRLDPSAVIARCERYFVRAEHQNEVSGQMENTAFVEGVVSFRGKWFVYYTMAEGGIGVATSDRPRTTYAPESV